MYSDWASLLPEIQSEAGDQSVLSRYSYGTGREVVCGIVRNLSANMSRCTDGLEENLLISDADVTWTMEIMRFGLSLPASDRDVTSECVSIYCDWMSCLVEPRKSVPRPLVEDPNKYFCQMLVHLTHLFKPRIDAGVEYTSQHVNMCNRVLASLQNVSSKSSVLTSESWISLLKFLLTVCDSLLGPPTVKDDLGSQMCERMLSVLFETWLVSCSSGHFPSPSLWKTLHEMCLGWRHHMALVTQWHRINSFLTSLLLKMFHGPASLPTIGSSSEECGSQLGGFRASNDVVVQCWFRFLHLIGNPIDFSRPRIISSTQRFLHTALASQEVVEPHQYECLSALPLIFYKAMKCISLITAAFLGSNQKSYVEMDNLVPISTPGQSSEPPSVTPPPARKQQRVTSFFPQLIKTRDASSRMSLGETWPVPTTPVSSQPMPPSAPSFVPGPAAPLDLQHPAGTFSFFRPRVNSLLHLLGVWLFDASLVGADVIGTQREEDWGNDKLQQYEAGRAQACGTLCRIFCSVKTDEEILQAYVARFYAVIFYGLKVDLETSSHPVLINIVLNSSDIFKVNLVGSQVLVPHYLRAIEFIQTMFRYKHDNSDDEGDQRFASTQLLLSMVCLPLHFRHLEIKNILDDQKHMRPTISFYSLQPTLIKLFLNILAKEVDPVNTQMLLGGIASLLADMALYEENSKSTKSSPQLFELYERAAVLVCERLIKSWTSELTSALSSMEVLQFFSTFESLKGRPGSKGEENALRLEGISKRIVVTICEFVVLQCNKPAICHSKDLHSSIVSAYQCLTTWLVEHDYLLQDGAVLHTVLQVTELGISGSCSQSRPSDPPVYKGKKELKPISLRVKDAAEALLAAMVDHVGSFPSPTGPESLCTLLDEDSFLSKFSRENCPKFQYFVVDGSVILGLFEPPTNEDTEDLPNLVVVTRSLFGRHVWLLKLCHQSRSKNITPPSTASSEVHFIPTNQRPQVSSPQSLPIEAIRYFPESVSQVPKVLADHSIPPIEKTMLNYEEQLESLRKMIDNQRVFEQESYEEHLKNYKPPPPCQPPSSSKISNAARLFLSHFGFLTLDNLRGGSLTGGMFPTLIKLNESNSTLWNDLKALDGISVRTYDTAHVYCVKAGQSKLEDMLANVVSESSVSSDFREFLLSLGWPVDVPSHPGWTGNPATSWKVRDARTVDAEDQTRATGGSCYDGKNKVLYWADVAMELVFVVPSSESVVKRDDVPVAESEKPAKQSGTTEGEGGSISTTAEGETLKLRRSGRVGGHGGGVDVQVVIVWLEHFEDHATFPVADLPKMSNHQQASEFKTQKQTPLSANNFCLIFVHPLHSGLFRIHLHTSTSKIGDGGPLVDGAVVSRRVLGQMIRQTTYNVYRRKTLESDIHQPPHVKRRIFIKEIVQRHKCPMTESDFCTSLFHC